MLILREDISGKEALLFPPAGMEAETAEVPERQYGLTFVGTMGDYFSQVLWIHGLERPKRFLANRFLLIMRQQPDLTLEQAFARAVEHQGLKLTDQEFLNHLRELCVTGYCVMHYYRARVVETILKSGIRLDVFRKQLEAVTALQIPESDLSSGCHGGGEPDNLQTVPDVLECNVMA